MDIHGVGRPARGREPEPLKDLIPPNIIKQFIDQNGYIDMGVLYGFVQNNFIDWWPTPISIDKERLDVFLDSLFTQLRADGYTNISYAFAQLNDIDKILSGQGGSPTDTIANIYKDNYPVTDFDGNFFQYFNAYAQNLGIKTDISFGGAIASEDDWKLSAAPDKQAADLAKFMIEANINSVDFDIESESIMTVNTPADVVTFFQTLHTILAGEEPPKSSTITVDGDVTRSTTGIFQPLFANFDALFDGVNLMLYSTNQYYLDADNPTWGIKEWLNVIPDPAKIHIGFYDSISYEDPSSSAGEQYDVKGLTRGQAAAQIFLDVLNALGYKVADMGEIFWWSDDPTTLSSDKVMEDFYAYLSSHSR